MIPKWRDATDEHVKPVLNLISTEALSVAAFSVDKTQPAWTKFWDEATCIHSRVANQVGGAINFIKAASLLKFWLFGQASIVASAHALKIGALPHVVSARKRLEISHDVILDSDIQGQANIEALTETWRSMNANQPLTNSLGIDWIVSEMRIATEQTEPLLLLPDYIAGIIHATNSQSNTLQRSAITHDLVTKARHRLSVSPRFIEIEEPVLPHYFDIFPEFKSFSACC